jgi:hypothetical protein
VKSFITGPGELANRSLKAVYENVLAASKKIQVCAMTGRAKLVLLVAVQQLFIHGAGFNFAKGFEIVSAVNRFRRSKVAL